MPVSAVADEARRRALESEVSPTPSATKPYWACPQGPCEAIVDPRPVRAAGHWALPAGGPLLEGSGEKGGYDPQDLRSAYKIPTSGGSNQTIALVEAYGYEEAQGDLATYRGRYGLEPCTKANGCFRRVNEQGEEANYPPPEEGWETETALDLDMASAACPHCHILLVEASTAYGVDLGQAVNTAVGLGATEISNSYGIPEQDCAGTNCDEYNPDYNHPGVVVTASAGDSGYDSGLSSPLFPAASPYVVAVGGTSLNRASNTRGWSEQVWSEPERALGTGSGCSRSELKPPWQGDKACTHRTDNDVAAVAACKTPVSVYSTAQEGWANICGTSVSAPLVAGIEAHASESGGPPPTADAFYQDAGALFDVTLGSNGVCTPPVEDEYLCHAEVGYDGPSGNGTPAFGPVAVGSEPPSPRTEPASGVTGAGGTLHGAVDPNGLETTYHFEYGTTTSYGTDVPVPDSPVGSSTDTEAVSQPITGLYPGTTYHYRLVAANSAGTIDGEDRAFKTTPP
ncbi:MAG TPA: S8 family serine peptidase, partial [Solirubrobacteraceae bacterium]|nr:S8 family serine peptidase [Solirubrobacteraceae bacterium]